MEGDRTATGRYTVAEAADALGISAEAVRSRVKRGTLAHEREGSTVYVLLADQTRPDDDRTPPEHDRTSDQTGLVEELRDRVSFLERELERRGDEAEMLHRIVAGLTQANTNLSARVPQLEAPARPREDPGPTRTPTDAADDAHRSPQAPQRPPWWRRMFGNSG